MIDALEYSAAQDQAENFGSVVGAVQDQNPPSQPPSDPHSAKISREEAEDYRAVVTVLNRRWRVIECRDGIQWILQRRAGLRHGQPRWDGRCYCRTREGLMRVSVRWRAKSTLRPS